MIYLSDVKTFLLTHKKCKIIENKKKEEHSFFFCLDKTFRFAENMNISAFFCIMYGNKITAKNRKKMTCKVTLQKTLRSLKKMV